MKIRHVHNGVFTFVDSVEKTVAPPEQGFYWIDANPSELESLQSLFKLEELDIEDCISEDEQRPKIVIHDHHYFLVINSIRFDDEEIFLRAANIFLGRHFIITVTKQKINELRVIKPILLQEEVNAPDDFLYHLVDLIVDSYFGVALRIEARIERLEEDILMHTKKTHLNEIIGLRSEILWLKKVLGPQRDLIGMLNKRDLKLINNQLQKYFSDIHENSVKIIETFDTFRDLMGNLREAYQSSLAHRANEIMRVFTALTTIFMPLTLITGIYGMNFEFMPETKVAYGFYLIIGFIVLVGTGMFFVFRKKEWL
jgi:magnesium transporter